MNLTDTKGLRQRRFLGKIFNVLSSKEHLSVRASTSCSIRKIPFSVDMASELKKPKLSPDWLENADLSTVIGPDPNDQSKFCKICDESYVMKGLYPIKNHIESEGHQRIGNFKVSANFLIDY